MAPRLQTIRIEPHSERGFRLLAEQFVPLPRETVFRFFADAEQLERITPPWLHFKILTPLPIEIRKGALIDYRLRLRGIPIRWQTEISAWEPCTRFVDQQLRGPYRKWHHEHRFEDVPGGTRVIDEVHYIVPGGRLVNRWFVEPDLRKIFGFRQERLEEIFATEFTQPETAPGRDIRAAVAR